MKARNNAFCIVAVLIALAAAARADDMADHLGLGANVGPSIPLGGSALTGINGTSLGTGAWLFDGLTSRWAARLAYDHLGFSGPSGLQTLNVESSYSIDPLSDWNPSLRMGIGPAFVHDGPDVNSTVFGFTVGLALDRFLAPQISIGAALDGFGAFKQARMAGNVWALRPAATLSYWFWVPIQ
jgi:hypothetical protein